jgi:DNA-binding CsgD family transcriptional regulator
MNLRARGLVGKYGKSARIEYGRHMVASFAMRAVFETRTKDAWVIPHVKGDRELEVVVHELKKEHHAIGEDLWLATLEETEYQNNVGIFARFALTQREEEVAVFLIETGLSYKLIADRLGTKYHTVRTQIGSIYRKCGVNSRSELAAEFKGRYPS